MKTIITLRKILKGVALFPWWLIVRILGWHRDHAWRHTDVRSLDGWIQNPTTFTALVLGWIFWAVVLAGLVWLFRG